MKWAVTPEDVKLDGLVYDGETFWIKVKKQLTVGEERRVLTSGWRGMSRQSDIQIDWQAQQFARAQIYLTDWSLLDDLSVKVPITRETLEAMPGALFAIIENAITFHVEKQAEEKKLPTGSVAPSQT